MSSDPQGGFDDWCGEEITMVTSRPMVDVEMETAPLHVAAEDLAYADMTEDEDEETPLAARMRRALLAEDALRTRGT